VYIARLFPDFAFSPFFAIMQTHGNDTPMLCALACLGVPNSLSTLRLAAAHKWRARDRRIGTRQASLLLSHGGRVCPPLPPAEGDDGGHGHEREPFANGGGKVAQGGAGHNSRNIQ